MVLGKLVDDPNLVALVYSFVCGTKCMRSWDAKCGQKYVYEKPNENPLFHTIIRKPSHKSQMGVLLA